MNSKTHVLADREALFYHLGMNWEEVWGVLKWVLAALVAGFVGQFGKSLALYLMKRRRVERYRQADSSQGSSDMQSVSTEKKDMNAQAKIDKKKAKAEVKRLKKS